MAVCLVYFDDYCQYCSTAEFAVGPRREMGTKSEIAVKKFLEGYNCAQSVLYSFCNELQIDENTALKMACGFGAGMGRKGEV